MPIRVKVKTPSRPPLNSQKLITELSSALEQTQQEAKQLFINTALDFDHQPPWQSTFGKNGYWSRKVWTDDENYTRLSGGTSPHLIQPRPGGVLAFPAGYKDKTKPGRLRSTPGGPFGDMVFTRSAVMNPGFPARQFEKQVKEKIEPKFQKRVNDAIRRAAKG